MCCLGIRLFELQTNVHKWRNFCLFICVEFQISFSKNTFISKNSREKLRHRHRQAAVTTKPPKIGLSFPPETQLDGNQTLLENRIGMESTPLLDPRGAGIIKNLESPQSAPAQVNVTSQGRYKATENRIMTLEFAYNRNAVGKAQLFSRSSLSMIGRVFTQLDYCHKQRFQSSCFKNLLKLRSTHVGYQIFHQLLMRQVQTDKTMEVWFKFKDKISRFGLQEFTLITGLNAGDLEEEVVEGKTVPRLLKNYFSNNKRKGKVNRVDLMKAFCKCNNPEDKYKLGLLVCLVWVLLGVEASTLLNPWLFFIVEDVDKFNNYPWGKKSFLYTIKNFKRKMKIESNKSPQKKDVNYNLNGFPLAVVIWGLEAIPAFGKKFADSIGEKVPRMLSWILNEKLISLTLDTFLEYEKYNVKCKLAPTEAEKTESFWQQLTHLDDKEDPKVDNIKDDDESLYGGADNDVENGEPDFSSDEDIQPETQRLFCASRQLGGNQTLSENHVGIESTCAGNTENPEGPQSAPTQLNVTSQGQYELRKRRKPQIAPEENKRARPATETSPDINSPSISDTRGGDLSDKTFKAKLDLLEKAAAALSDLVPEFRSRPPSSVLCELENLKLEIASLVAEKENTKEELMVSRSKEKELEASNSRLTHENTELSSRCASLVAEDKKTKEELTVSRTKETELEASNSKLRRENKKFSVQCAVFEAEYRKIIQELTVASRKEKELEDTLSKLTHKNKVFSAECSSYESQIVALEAEYEKIKEELSNADIKFYSGARAAGYAEGVKEGKSKWLKSAEFLDCLTDASVKFFDYGFDSCQKQAEQQGFVGKLDKNSALNEALLKGPTK